MWRYREHIFNKTSRCRVPQMTAYLWETDDLRYFDRLCIYSSDNLSRIKMLLIYFSYNFNMIDLNCESFIDSVRNCIHKTSISLHGFENVSKLFRHIKNENFLSPNEVFTFIEDINNKDSSKRDLIIIDNHIENNAAFIADCPSSLFSVLYPKVEDLLKQDEYADTSCYSDAKEYLTSIFNEIAIKVYGDFFGENTYDHLEDMLLDELVRKYFPLTPLNIAKYTRELILRLYPIKVALAELINVKYPDKIKEEMDKHDLRVFEQLLAASGKRDRISSIIESTIDAMDLADDVGYTDVVIGTF